MKLYKTTYKGSYKGSCYELDVFKDTNEIIWLDSPNFNKPIEDVEHEIILEFENKYPIKEPKNKNYRIPITWQSQSVFHVDAKSLQDAVDKALNEFFSIPDLNYIEDSFEVDPSVAEEYPDEEFIIK